ncbi:hypothetical protein MNBD_GAMMA09-1997 [hydrothermal vent metagenome]|uniref:Uncharacterized protein n=1 Tax=hydrothermal vent metagenome TaxID=652676 RepID=A0A3B0YM58_9ZZZZ
MLNYFRHHPLRKSLWLIVLFSSLLIQSQNLFACEMMDNGVKTTCCCDDASNSCPMGGGCETSQNTKMSGCCDVSTQINVGLQDIVVADAHHSKQILSLDAPQPPPAIIIEYQVSVPLQGVTRNLNYKDFQYSTAFSGTGIYTRTNRFRI